MIIPAETVRRIHLGWYRRLAVVLTAGLAVWLVLLVGGCSRLNDYMSRPMIIDASDRPAAHRNGAPGSYQDRQGQQAAGYGDYRYVRQQDEGMAYNQRGEQTYNINPPPGACQQGSPVNNRYNPGGSDYYQRDSHHRDYRPGDYRDTANRQATAGSDYYHSARPEGMAKRPGGMVERPTNVADRNNYQTAGQQYTQHNYQTGQQPVVADDYSRAADRLVVAEPERFGRAGQERINWQEQNYGQPIGQRQQGVPVNMPANSTEPQVTGIGVSEAAESHRPPALATARLDYATAANSGGAQPYAPTQPAMKTRPADTKLGGNLPAVNVPVRPEVNRVKFAQPAVAQQSAESAGAVSGIAGTIAELERKLAARPGDVYTILALRSLYLANGQADKAQNVLPDDPDNANRMLAALNDLHSQVAEKADLIITTVNLCGEGGVKGFGQYQELPLSELASGEPRTVLVYCELDNYQTERNDEGKYQARLHATITLYDANYGVIRQLSQDVPDVPSPNPRRDFFLRGALNLPRLAPGRYQLTVQIEDKIANKIARPQHIFFDIRSSYDNQRQH